MNKHPSVSIYIVTYLNSEERCAVLRRTCQAALAQRYPDFEVVVSDNAGRIPAQEALDEFHDERLKVFRNETNLGFTGNMNRCSERCANDIIKPLCDDDLLHPDFLAQTVPLVDDETLVLVDVEKYTIGVEPAEISQPVSSPPEVALRSPGCGRDLWELPFNTSSIPSATLFTKKLFNSLGGYDDGTITSDWDFMIEAGLSKRIVHVKHRLCFVGVWGGSLTEQMLQSPFFYPKEKLYTQFRVLYCKPLNGKDRRGLWALLVRQFLCQSLRPWIHLRRGNYWRSYGEYLQRFALLMHPWQWRDS